MEYNIHNDFFINIIKNRENARDFLAGVLPENIYKLLDLTNIDFDDTSYIQNRFKDLFSDIVIKTKIANRNVDIYLLVEHKSTVPDKNSLFLQILSYIYSMFEEDYKNGKDFRIVIPLVFYHGTKKWEIPGSLQDLFDVDNNIKQIIVNFSYLLYDTNNFNEEQKNKFHNNLILISSLIALKSAFNKNDLESVLKIFENLNRAGLLNDFNKIEIFLIYILRTKNIEEKEIVKIISNYNSEGGKKMETLADYFLEKGIKQGIQQGEQSGIEKGKIEGELEGRIKTAKKMKQDGLSFDLISKYTGLTIEDINKL